MEKEEEEIKPVRYRRLSRTPSTSLFLFFFFFFSFSFSFSFSFLFFFFVLFEIMAGQLLVILA